MPLISKHVFENNKINYVSAGFIVIITSQRQDGGWTVSIIWISWLGLSLCYWGTVDMTIGYYTIGTILFDCWTKIEVRMN